MVSLLYTGITNRDLDGVIAYYPTAGIDSNELFFLLMDLLVEIQAESKCIIAGVVCELNLNVPMVFQLSTGM